MSEHKIPIPSMLYNAAVGGHVTNSQQIIDENENKEQSQINAEVKQILGQGGSVDTRIANAVNTEKTRAEEAVEAGYDKSIETFYGIINGNIWIGPGQNYSDVYDNDDYKYENINVNNPLNIECIQDYIYVIYPADSEFMFNLTMSGFSVPMEPVDTTTIQDYYILKSVNQYDG